MRLWVRKGSTRAREWLRRPVAYAILPEAILQWPASRSIRFGSCDQRRVWPARPPDDAEKLQQYIETDRQACELPVDLQASDVPRVQPVAEEVTAIESVFPATVVTDAEGKVFLAAPVLPPSPN